VRISVIIIYGNKVKVFSNKIGILAMLADNVFYFTIFYEDANNRERKFKEYKRIGNFCF